MARSVLKRAPFVDGHLTEKIAAAPARPEQEGHQDLVAPKHDHAGCRRPDVRRAQRPQVRAGVRHREHGRVTSSASSRRRARSTATRATRKARSRPAALPLRRPSLRRDPRSSPPKKYGFGLAKRAFARKVPVPSRRLGGKGAFLSDFSIFFGVRNGPCRELKARCPWVRRSPRGPDHGQQGNRPFHADQSAQGTHHRGSRPRPPGGRGAPAPRVHAEGGGADPQEAHRERGRQRPDQSPSVDVDALFVEHGLRRQGARTSTCAAGGRARWAARPGFKRASATSPIDLDER